MKKLIAILLLAALLGSMCACGAESAVETTAAKSETKPAPTVQVVEGEPIEQLDDVSVYIPVTGEAKTLDGLGDYIFGEGTSPKYRDKVGRYEQKSHIFQKTDAASFITFLQSLEANGWEQYSNNIIEGTNLFATYTKDGASVYCYYISTKNTAYVHVSPNQLLEAREVDNQYEAVCDTLLTQNKLLYKVWSGGMGYIIRLSDGRFIIVDSGHSEKDFAEANNLYARLEAQNVLDKITIAAWIITHPHRDHLGGTGDFLRYYNSSQVEIQQFIFNFPTDEILASVDDTITTDVSDTSKMPTFFMALESLWGQVPITVAHTGQCYYFADAKIEILHTYEDFWPQDLVMQSQDPVNGASVIFSLEVGGQKTMFLADSAVDCSKDLVKMWGSYLKSDIMQAAHHGLNGGSVALYEAIDPVVVLVPSSTRKLEKALTFSQTQWLWNNGSSNIKELIVAEWEERTFTLPYTPATDAPYFATTEDPWEGLADKYKTN